MSETLADWVVRALSYGVVGLSSLAAMVLIAAAAPGFLRRERRAARAGMRRCFVWGSVFVTACVLWAALLALLDGAVGRVIALAMLVGLLVVSLAGLAAIATEVGQRVLALAERHQTTVLSRLCLGTAVLFTTAIIPVFGWLVFAGALLTGIGAFLDTAVQDYRPTRRPALSGEVVPGDVATDTSPSSYY